LQGKEQENSTNFVVFLEGQGRVESRGSPMTDTNEKAFGEVEASLEKSGRVEELIRLYETRSREVPSPEEAAHLLSRAGDMARERLRNGTRAEEYYRRALSYAPQSREGLFGLRVLAEQRSDHGLLADVLEKLGLNARGDEAAALYLRAGELWETKLSRRDRAVLCYQLASRATPNDRQTYQRARKLLLAEGHFGSVYDSLERERAVLGDRELLEAYLGFADALVLYPQQHALATKALVRALAIDGKNARATAAQKELSKLEYVWREKVKALKNQSLEERDRRQAARLSLQVARLFAFYEPGATAKIKEAIDRCFALWPAMPDALELLEEVAEKSGDVRVALTVFSKLAAESRDRSAQVDLQLRIGQVLLTRVNDRVEAAAAFAEAARLDPSRGDAANLASELAIELGHAPEALSVLERHLATVKSPGSQVQLRLTLSDLAGRLLKDPATVRRHLEGALQVDPGNAQVAFALAKLHAEAGTLASAWPLLELAAAAPRPASERVALCEYVALLCEEAGDPARAVTALSLALPLDPARTSLLDALRAQAAQAKQESELASTLRRVAQVAPREAQGALFRQLGLLMQTLERPSEAQEAWIEVQKRHPDDAEAAQALAAVRKALAEEPQDPRSKLEAQARKLEAQAAEPAAAAAVYRQILELDPDSAPTLRKLGAAAARLGQWDEVALVAERLTAIAETVAERQEWRGRLAQLLAERLGRGDEAARLYLNLLQEGSDSAAVVAGLERLAGQGVRQVEISRALAPLYARSGDSQRQVASLLVLLGSTSELDEQKSLLRLLAETTELRLLDVRAALEYRLRGLQLDPADSGFRVESVRLARGLEAQHELSRAFVELSTRVREPAQATSLLVEASELAQEARSTDDAARALLLALTRSPAHPELLARLSALYLSSGRNTEAVDVLRQRFALTDDRDEKQGLALTLSRVNRELGRPREAAQALADALLLGASEAEQLATLAALYEQGGQPQEQSDVLARLIALCEAAGEKDRAQTLSFQRARLLETALGDKAEAIRRYADVLARTPNDADALSALEHLLADPQHREAAARALLPAYAAASEHRKQVAALGVIAEASNDTLARVTALREAAVVHTTQLRQLEQAFVALAQAMRIAPADPALRAEARAAAEAADLLDSHAEVLEEILSGGAGPAAVAIHRELAELLEKKLDDHAGAVTQLQSVLALEPKNVEALRALQRLHRAHEAWSGLADVTERLALLETDAAARTALDREAAVLAEQRLEDLERAALDWRQIATRDPQDRDAASALDRLNLVLDRPPELAFALELRRSQEGASAAGREFAFRLAQLRQTRLEDPLGALELYRQLLAEDPAHEGARAALDAWARTDAPHAVEAAQVLDPVLASTGDHPQRIALRTARLGFTPEAAARAQLSSEVRGILERDLRQPEAAFMQALKGFTEGVDRAGLQPELERLAQVTQSFDALAEVYETTAEELVGDAPQSVALFRRAAQLRTQLDEPEDAVRVWKLLLERAPEDREALDALSALYATSQNARSLAEVHARKAALAASDEERHALLLQAAQAWHSAAETGQAIEALRGALALKPTREVLSALDQLYQATHQAAEQAEVLLQLSQLIDEPEAKTGFLLRRGLLLEREGHPVEALGAYVSVIEVVPGQGAAVQGLERLLHEEPTRVDAARALEKPYREASELKKLVEVLEVRLGVTAAGSQVALLLQIAALREATGQKSQALGARLKAFAAAPDDAEVREELERLAAELGAFEELAAAYEDALDQQPKEPLGADLWRRLAGVYQDRLGRFDLAARAWNEVLARTPKDVFVLEALARLYRRTSAFKELSIVMRRQLALETQVTAQVNLLFELATLADETLADKALAAQCYQAILERKPDDVSALKLLGRILAETERYPELAALLSRESALAQAQGHEEEALELQVRLGRLKLTRLGDPRGALETLQEVLRRRPGHAGAIGALEEMAKTDNPVKGEAAVTLEPVFAEGGDHLKLVQMIEAQVGTETDPAARAALLRRMADIYAKEMDNVEMAFVVSTRALREVPDDPKHLELALALARKADTLDEIAAVLVEVAPRATQDAARAGLYRALARLQTQNDELDEAVESWKRVNELVPTDTEAIEQVGKLLGVQGRPQEMLEVLKRQLTIEEDTARRVHVLGQMAALQADALKDPQAAASTYRRLLELKPDDTTALGRLEKILEAEGRWPELADVLGRRLQAASPEDKPQVAFKLAFVRETRLLDKNGALELYAELLTQNARHGGALQRVEAIVQREPQNQVGVEALLKAYRQGEPLKLAQLLEARAGVSPDALERKALLLELATVREAQGEPELRYLALYRAFKEDPNDAELRQRLEGAADAAHSYDELTSAYEEELPRIAEAVDAARVCLKLGQVFETRLQEPEKAIEYYEKARQFDPAVGNKGLSALDRLYGQSGQPARQAQAIEALAALATEPADKVGLNFRLGQLATESLDSPDRAANAFEKVLETDPRHLPSLRSLEQLYEHAQMSEKLFRVLEAQRDLVQGPEKERVLTKMASVSAEGLSNVDNSITLYRELLEKNPRNEQAFDALSTMLDRADRTEELRELLAWKLQVTIDPRELVRLNERLGRVLSERLNRPEEAIAYFKAALERDARNRGALEAVRDIFEKLGKKEDVIIVLRRLIPLQEDASGVKAIRIRLAELFSETSRREEALDAARRALEVEPHNVTELERIHVVFVALKAWADAVKALEQKAQVFLRLEERDPAVETWFRVAELWKGPAGKVENAGTAFEHILEIDPANRGAYEQALTHFEEVNDWRSYAQAMDRFLQNLVTDDEKVASLRALGRVQEQKLGQKHVAFLTLCRAVQLTPDDDELRGEVERLASETGGYEELAAVYEEVADDQPRGPLAERLYLTLARVHDEHLDDAEAAERELRKVLEFDPTNEAALSALSAMFARRGQDKQYIVSLEQTLEAAPSFERRKEILREIARVYDTQLNNPDDAEAALVRALDLEPDAETLQTLVTLQRRQKNFPAVASTLLRLRDVVPTPEERSHIQLEVAVVYERDLGDDEAAVEGYRQALEFDPANGAALDALERLYSKLDRPAELLSVYERQLELTHDYRERVKILFKSAGIWEERFANLPHADLCIEAALQVDPNNVQAIKTLERLRKAQGRWDELIGVVDRHLQLLTDPTEKAELCVEMGDIFHQQLKAVDRAVVAYHQAIELDPRCRPAMHALGTLYERSGNWPFALDMLEREAQVAGATPEAVELYFRMGKINEDMLLDSGNARRAYLEALKIDPAYLPAIRSLKTIYEQTQDWENYEKALAEEANRTEDTQERAEAYLAVARYAESREDRDGATKAYEEALHLQPDSLEAARPLADIYLSTEAWPSCEKMLDIVTRQLTQQYAQRSDDVEFARELCRRQYRLGYVCEKLGKKDKALAAYEKAYQLDSTYLAVLEGYGNLLVHSKRFEEALKVYQSILLHHRGDLTDLEVAEIYWTLGDLHLQLNQFDRAENHFEKALGIDGGHEPSLRSMVTIAEATQNWERAAEFNQKLLQVLDGEAKYEVGVKLGQLAREKLRDAYVAIDAYLAAHRIRPQVLEVMDALYVLYRETKQGQKAAEMLEKMLVIPELKEEPARAKRVWFSLGEISRDELQDVEKATHAFNQALDLDWRFIDAFSALEAMLGRNKRWKTLDENYKRMLGRFPKTEETHVARMTLWKALGDLYLNVLKAPDAAVEVYKVVAAGLPDNVEVQEAFAALAQTQPGYESQAIEAWRRALPSTSNPGKVASALAEIAARQKDYDGAYVAAQVVAGLIGDPGQGEREILTKLGPYAKKREVAQRALTDRLWQQHLFHPKVRGPLSELLAILFEQAGGLYKEDFTRYGINPKRHLLEVASAPEYQIHHYRYVAKVLGMEQVSLFSPFLVATRDRMAKKSTEAAPDPMVGVEICHTDPISLRVGGKFFSETGQKEVYYLLGRTMALLRPELALTSRLSAERLEAVLQAAISLSVDRFRFSADPRAIDTERRALEKALTEQARTALARVTKEYVKVATPNDLRNYLEGAELSATRAGVFVAGEIEPVKRMILAETGSSFRVQPRSKIRDLMVFALGEDLHTLRQAVGISVEVQLRK
jgi:tetratricopeptide (TPR) repeat protein